MSDIATVWVPAKVGADWVQSGPDLMSGNDLETQVLISLFTDRLANADDAIPDGGGDPRGWWGDVAGQPRIGSRLWLLSRAKLTIQTALRAKDFCTEALQWLIDDGVASKVDVTTQIIHPNRLNIGVTILRDDGTRQALKYLWAWNDAATVV